MTSSVLARHAARQARGRDVDFTATAERALQSCGWRDNIDQLIQVIRLAVVRTNVIDARQLPPEVLNGPHRRLARLEAFERDEIVRLLTRVGATVTAAAAELGVSRATM